MTSKHDKKKQNNNVALTNICYVAKSTHTQNITDKLLQPYFGPPRTFCYSECYATIDTIYL